MTSTHLSPCMRCTRVSDPGACDDKSCVKWRRWFVERWDSMRRQPRLEKELPAGREGICIGGVVYAQPHRVRSYLHTDPCEKCLCPRDLCALPCREKRNWLSARQALLGS